MASSTDKEVSLRLQAMEEKHDLLSHKFDGYCAWALISFSVARTLSCLPHDSLYGQTFTRTELIMIACNDVINFIRASQVRLLAFSHSVSHTEIENGLRKDFYVDDLLLRHQDSCKVEMFSSRA